MVQNPSLAHAEPPQSGGSSLVPQSAKGTADGDGLGSAQRPKLDMDSPLPAAQSGIRSSQDPEQRLSTSGSLVRVLASSGSSCEAGRSRVSVVRLWQAEPGMPTLTATVWKLPVPQSLSFGSGDDTVLYRD